MDIKNTAKEIVGKMSLEEKALMLSGRDFWRLYSFEKYGLPEITVTDGPHGIRKQANNNDNLGLFDSLPSVAYPTAATTACSFDEELLHEMGELLAAECHEQGVSVLLGPAINHKRSPLCGRNFEYVSEDPYLSGNMAAALINGLQEGGVGVSVKHFACNNQEYNRMISDSRIDERTMRELYLRAFEIVVKKSKPWTIMGSYNRINGEHATENEWLMNKVARGEWGFDGVFVTDWGALNDIPKSFSSGLDLEMPGVCRGTDARIVEGVKKGSIKVEAINASAERVVELILKSVEGKKQRKPFDLEKALAAAERISRESSVLLKNEGVLPLLLSEKVAVVGAMAKTPRYQGAGSSKIVPVALDNALEAFEDAKANYVYAAGCNVDGTTNDDLLAEAKKVSESADKVVLFIGLPDVYESEGYDRKDMKLPEGHLKLVEAVCAANKNVAVVLQCGSPVELPFADEVKGLLATYLSGCRGGHATVDLLYGKANPCGKLAETYPLALSDVPCAKYFSETPYKTEYRESIFSGYRYYLSADKSVRFPFGYGLSYTSFEYGDLKIGSERFDGKGELSVSLTVKNTGSVFGKEIVQLYVGEKNPRIFKAKRELKGFIKVALSAGEQKTVEFKLDREAFTFYNVLEGKNFVEGGTYTVEIGASAADIRLSREIEVVGDEGKIPDYKGKADVYYNLPQGALEVSDEAFVALSGLPITGEPKAKPFTTDSTVSSLQKSFFGNIVYKKMMAEATKKIGDSPELKTMAEAMMGGMPIRALGMTGGMNKDALDGIIDIANGHLLRGAKKMKGKE